MKKIVSTLFMALFCLVSGVMSAQTDNVVRILAIGNSFSVDAVNRAAKLTGIRIIIPCGTAVQNARTTIFNGTMTRDGYHLHMPYGRYTAACTWYEKIFGKNVIGNTYRPKGMTPEQCLAAQKSAHAAVKKPNRVTKIK